MRAVLAFLGYAALSTLWSATVAWDEVLRGVVKCLAIMFFLLSVIFYGRRASGLVGPAIVLGATANCVVSLALFVSSGRQLFLDRLDGIGMKAIAISTAASYALAILIVYRSRLLTNGVARGVLCSVLLAGMILSMSRGPLWALAAAIGIGVAPQRRKRVLWTIVASLLCVAAASFSMNRLGKFYDLMLRPSGRIAIWREADTKLAANDLRLFFGFGLGDETIYTLPGYNAGSPPLVFKDMAHNAYLSNLTKTGLIGSCLLLSVVVNALRLAHKSRRSRPLLLAWLVFALGSMLTDYQIIKSFGFEYVLFWLPIAWLCLFEINDKDRCRHSAAHELAEPTIRAEGRDLC
ncbi:MAG TPA: O-antigen ligase family protein [Gemmataceae bacterium]|nr:O-antigen ligase family protein [Gemmataceae bacterium]